MRRREFITLLGGAAAAWPIAARAQQGERMRRIGVLMGYAESDRGAQARLAAFRDGLQKLGWTEGRNIRIDTRWVAPGDAEARQQFAKELVALQPDLILSHSTPNTATLLQQTRTIPIIFAAVSDPVGSGFVASFPRPGGNITGFINMEPTMAGKWMELLKEIAPRVARVAFLFNPATAPYAEYWLNPFKTAAASFAVQAIGAPVRDTVRTRTRHCRTGTRAEWRPCCDAGYLHERPSHGDHGTRSAPPPPGHLCDIRFFVELGGLLSYGNEPVDNYPARRDLCRSHPQGREAERTSGPGPSQV